MKNFRRIFPANERQKLDGGLNTKYERSLIDNSESPDCANVAFSNGAVATREGSAKLNTTAVGTYVCDGLYTRRSNTGAETMVAWFGGTMWQLAATTFSTIGSAQSVFTAGVRVGAAQAENYIFFGNGNVRPYKYNGTDFTRHGVYPPTSANIGASAAFGAASAATGAALASGSSYTYKLTFRNTALVESDLGDAKTFVVTANSMGNIALTSLPVAPQSFGVGARIIYRTVAGGSTFKKVATLSDNTTTTYDDGVTDANLGATAPTDNGVPPLYSTIFYHQGRLFMNDTASPNYIWYTELNQPYTVASTNFIRISDNATDIVKGFGVYDNSLVVFCERSIWFIYMPDQDDANWSPPIRSRIPYGTKSPHAIFGYDNKLFFVAMQSDKIAGFGSLAGDTLAPSESFLTVSVAQGELTSNPIETDVFDTQSAYFGNISGIVYQNAAYITTTHGDAATTNNRIWMLDFSKEDTTRSDGNAWVPWTGLAAAQFTVYAGNLYYGSATANGFVYRLLNGTYSDSSSAIDSYFWTKEFSGLPGEQNFSKDFRYVNLLIDTAGNYYMTVRYRVDSDSGDGNAQNVLLDPGGSAWGTMMWGIDDWGGGLSQKEVRLYLDGARGKRIQFKFTNQNTADQRFKVHGLNFAYNLKGYR